MSDPFYMFRILTIRRYGRIAFWIAKQLVRLLSASVEIFLRGNFGRRYLPTLTLAFFFFGFCASFLPQLAAPSSLFLLGSLLLILHHWLYAFSRRRRSLPEPHTVSTGDSWYLWDHLNLDQTPTQRYAEPLLCFLVGLLFLQTDPFLSIWLRISALALFVKGQISRIKTVRRIMDAADARLAAQKLNQGLNRYFNHGGNRAQQAHQARLPHNPQPGP